MVRITPSRAALVLAAFSLLTAGPSPGASAAADAAGPRLDHAPFARAGGWSGRTPFDIEFHEIAPAEGKNGRAYDPFLESPDAIPHLGLQWEETRYLSEVALTFAEGSEVPPEAEVALEYWWLTWLNPGHVSPRVPGEGGFSDDDCDDPYRGEWIRARTEARREGRRIALRFEPLGDEFPRDPRWKDYKEPLRRARMIRILFPGGARPRIAAIEVHGRERLVESDLFVEPGAGRAPAVWEGSLEVYNGKLLGVEGVRFGPGDSANPDGSFRLATEPGKGLRVRLLRSAVDREDHARTILTVRGPETFSFLPQDADAGEKIWIPDLGAFAASTEGGWTHERLLSPGVLKRRPSILGRVLREPEQSLERAYREIPGLRKISPDGSVVRYVPIGAGDHWERFLVRATGAFFCRKGMLTLVRDQRERIGWAGDELQVEIGGGDPPSFPRLDADTSQSVEEGRLPIVLTRWKADGLDLETAAFQTTADGPIRAGLRGDEPTCGIAVIGWRWPEGGSRAARLSLRITPAEEVRLSGGAVLVRAARLPGKEGEPPQRAEYPRERLRLAVDLGGPGSAELREDPARPGAQLVSLTVEPKAGETERRVAVKIPFAAADTPERIQGVIGLDPFRALEEVRLFWRARLSAGTRIDIPDRPVAEFFDAAAGHVLVSGFRDPVAGLSFAPCASVNYGALVNEGCYEVEFLDQRGLHADARRYLEGILECQGSQTVLPGRFRSSREVFHALRLPDGASYGDWEYAVSHGFALVTAANHYRYTGDAAWLARYAGRLAAGAEWVLREREATKRTRPSGERVWEWGLTPAARLNDNVDWRYWYVINAYQVAGVREVAAVLGEIGHPASRALAEGARAYREDFLAAVRRSIELAPVVKLRDGTWVPHVPIAPYLRGRSSPEIDVGYGGIWLRDVCYSPIFLASTGVLDASDRILTWILRDHEDNVFMDPKLRHLPPVPPDLWFSQGGIHNWPAGTDYPVIYSRRGEVPAALRYLYNSFAMLLFRDTNHFSEHVFEYGVWPTSPLFKTSDEAAWLIFFRALLVREDGGRLVLAGGTPRAWLADGKEVSIRGAATFFGPAGFRIRSRAAAGRIDAEVDPPARRPDRSSPLKGEERYPEIHLYLRHPSKAPLRAVRVDGKEWKDFDPAMERVTLKPAGPGRISVEADF
jgi:hypothetical protein